MGLREQKKAQLRQRILATGVELFRERGLAEARIRDLTRRIPVSDATFYNYFPSKEALLAEWAAQLVLRPIARAAAAPDGSGNPRRALRAALAELAGAVERDRELLADAWPRLPSLAAATEEAARAARALERFFERGQASGELRRDVPAAQLAQIMTAAVEASITSWLRAPPAKDVTLPAHLGRAVDLVLDGGRRRHERVRRPAASRTVAPG